MTTRRANTRLLVAVTASALALGVASTIGLAASGGAFRTGRSRMSCSSPTLRGAVVDVRLMNMGGPMMGGNGWMGGSMMGGNGWMGGMMRIATNKQVAPAGTVSFRVANFGSLVHELVVLPVDASVGIGGRTIGSDNRVDEAGSLGEASRTCGAGGGDGIAPGAYGWVTLKLAAGEYELICNLTGHYAAGMYTSLRVK